MCYQKKALAQLKAAGIDIDILKDKSLPLEQRLQELGKAANNTSALLQIFGEENVVAGQIMLQNIPTFLKELTAQSK